MLMKIFLSLGLGYALCVLAKKEKGLLKTVGYTFGISIIVLSLAYGAIESHVSCKMYGMKCGISKMCDSMSKACPMMKHK